MVLYHYYEKGVGPFRNLSDLPMDKANEVQTSITQQNLIYAAKRKKDYLMKRAELEQMARRIFLSKGGKPTRNVPHYMVVEECPWLQTWYLQGEYIKIPITDFNVNTLSFSYGDMFPTFSPFVTDNKEYRRQIYTFDEILGIIQKYGLPQLWNADGKQGPERYIEVQIWSDDTLSKYYKHD